MKHWNRKHNKLVPGVNFERTGNVAFHSLGNLRILLLHCENQKSHGKILPPNTTMNFKSPAISPVC
jgi:hypothetical protein